MDPSQWCPSRSRHPPPNPMYPMSKHKPLYASVFQPKGGMRLVEPTMEVPLFYGWTADCVGRWLVEIGFGKYSDMFRSKGIDGRRLYHMSAEDHHRLGVNSISEADQIVQTLQALHECVENEKAAIPTGLPYHHYKSLYFGEQPLYMEVDIPPGGCSK